MPVYLDCCASTPIHPSVREVVFAHLAPEYGNAGGLHTYGERARYAIKLAQIQVASLLGARWDQVLFTSGATESNNLAISAAREKVIASAVEHPSVLSPLKARNLETTLLRPDRGGWVSAGKLSAALQPGTDFVSLMHANHETGILQPVQEFAEMLQDHPALLHVDASQTAAWRGEELNHPGIDLITLSGHKMYGPQGIGALVVKSDKAWEHLRPQILGGGQQEGIRSGTLPVSLVAGLGQAAKLALELRDKREKLCRKYRAELLRNVTRLGGTVIGSQERTLNHVALVAFPGLDAYAAVRALKRVAAVSAGAACSSGGQQPSPVLLAMGYNEMEATSALRLSWCAQTPPIDWSAFAQCLGRFELA